MSKYANQLATQYDGSDQQFLELTKVLVPMLERHYYIKVARYYGTQHQSEVITRTLTELQHALIPFRANMKLYRYITIVMRNMLGKVLREERKHYTNRLRRDYDDITQENSIDNLIQEEDYLVRRKWVERQLVNLSPRQREAVAFTLAGNNERETAERMGIKYQCVQEYLAVAKKKLKGKLNNDKEATLSE